MPNGGLKKRRLTPNATEKKVKTKRVRRDSDPCVSKSDSPLNECEEEGSEDACTTLTLKRSVPTLSRDETKIVQLLKVSAFKYTKTCCNSLETISCQLASKEALVPKTPELICT